MVVYNTVLEYAGGCKNLGRCGPASLGVGIVPDSPETSASSTCYCTKFGCCMPNCTSGRKIWSSCPAFQCHEVIATNIDQSATYDFLLVTSSSSPYLFHSHNAVKMRQKNIKTFGMKKDNKARSSALTVDPYTTRHNSVNCTSIKYKL